MLKRFAVLVSVILLAMFSVLVGCGGNSAPAFASPSTPAVPERSKVVNIGFSEKPRTLDPHNAPEQGSETTNRMFFETLIYSSHDGSPYTPLLAESWDIAPDGKSWTFYLRKGVFWHNGDPFNADDVVATYTRLSDRRDDLGYFNNNLADFESVEKIDEHTVKVNFSQPYPLAGNSFRGTYIIPAKAYEELGDDLFHLQYCYGTGPWMLVEWVDGQYSHFKKNPDYWNKAVYDPYFEEVYIWHIGEPASAVAAHISGSLDAYTPSGGINYDMLPLYAGTEDTIEIVSIETSTNWFLQFQCREDNPFTDIKVRQALDMAIDRQLIIDAILGGGRHPIGLWAPEVTGHDPKIDPYVYDPDRARQLLAESTYDGRTVQILSYPNAPKAEEICLYIADMANKVGFNMTVAIEATNIYGTRRATGDYDVFGAHVSFPDGVPFRIMNVHVLNDIYKNHFNNAELNAIVQKFNVELDPAQRKKYAQEFNRFLRDHTAPQVAVAHLNAIYAVNYGIVGIDLYPDGLHNFSYVDYDPSKVK